METIFSGLPEGLKIIAVLGAGLGMGFFYWLKFVKSNTPESIQQEIIKQIREEKEYEREERLKAESELNAVLDELYRLRAEVMTLNSKIEGLTMLLEKYGMAGEK